MISLNEIKGQNNAIQYLLGSLSSKRIANSYLFSGPSGIGRALSAKAFTRALICRESSENQDHIAGSCSVCRRIESLEHPDLIWIKPEKNKAIKIDEIRKVREALSLKPYESPVSVCVIEDAHMMTVEASNALLKIMEEPPGDSLLILITNKQELLLETVISRCTEVRFIFLSAVETKEIIMREAPDIDEENAYFLSYFSQGSPGRAIELIDDGLDERKNDIVSLVGNIVKDENPVCHNWNKEDKSSLLEDLDMLIMFFRDITLGKEGLKKLVLDKDIIDTDMYQFFKKYSVGKIYDIVGRLIAMRRALTGNVNPKLVAQALPGMLAG